MITISVETTSTTVDEKKFDIRNCPWCQKSHFTIKGTPYRVFCRFCGCSGPNWGGDPFECVKLFNAYGKTSALNPPPSGEKEN